MSYTSKKGKVSDRIDETLECNIYQANRDDVVKSTTGFAVSYEIPLRIDTGG